MAGLKILALFSCFVALAYAAPTADLVTNLPGLNFQPNFLHYSGYLNAAPTRKYHYWMVRHQYATSTSPVILWLNGGPGCSSVGGLIEELGPFHVSDNGNTVYENRWAWNKVGHVIFLESPAGVGFSYATDGNTRTNDDQTAQDNHDALVDFFTTKFPELKQNDFYLTGESYGGVYIPTLAVLISQDKTNFPGFKGIAIGNGYYNVQLNINTQPALFYYHGIARQNLFDQAVTQCCNNNPYKCDYYDMNGHCANIANELLNQANDLDPYNLYNVCYLDGGSRSKRNFIRNKLMKKEIEKNLIKPHTAASLPLCAQDTNTETYLNRPDVRTALHIPANVGHWYDCADIHYTQIYNDVTSQFKTLLQNKVELWSIMGMWTVCAILS
jgi:cathepsin A (carboxypeptidase C)